MQVNKNLSQELYQDAGEEKTTKAKKYINQGKINIHTIRINHKLVIPNLSAHYVLGH